MNKSFGEKLLWMIPLALILGILFAVMEWPLWIALTIFVFLTGIEIPIMLYVLYGSQNLKQIAEYIDRQQKNPVFVFLKRLREGTDEELLDAINAILEKYKQPKVQAVYGANKAMMLRDFETARRLVEPIASSEMGQYTMELIEAMQGNREAAGSYSFQKEWMKASIEANLAFVEKDRKTFKQEVEKAIHSAKGIQYYSNTYVFKRMEEEWQ